jgi:hypothetical protein
VKLANPWFRGLPQFSRNLAPQFTHYLNERPDMTSNHEKSKKAKTMKGNDFMKNRNILLTGTMVALAFALAPVVEAAPRPDGGPVHVSSLTGSANANRGTGAQFGIADNILPLVSISFAPIGLTMSQTARLNLVNVGVPNGMTISWRFIDAGGLTLAQSVTTLTYGKVVSVDYKRRPDPPPAQAESVEQLRAEMRAEVDILTPNIPSESIRRSLELFDSNTGATTVFMGGQ